MLNLLTHSRVLQYTIYAAAIFSVFGLFQEPGIDSVFATIGWLLASMLWYTTQVRTWQIEYMVAEVKRHGGKVTSEGEEI